MTNEPTEPDDINPPPDETLVIKKQAHFDASLAEAVPIAEYREEVERAIRFAIGIPGMAKRAGQALPLALPLYALPLRKSAFNPPLVVYYCQYKNTILLMSARLTENTQE